MRRTRSDLLQFLECKELSLDVRQGLHGRNRYLPLHGIAPRLGHQLFTTATPGVACAWLSSPPLRDLFSTLLLGIWCGEYRKGIWMLLYWGLSENDRWEREREMMVDEWMRRKGIWTYGNSYTHILSSDFNQTYTPPLVVIRSIYLSYIIIKLYHISDTISFSQSCRSMRSSSDFGPINTSNIPRQTDFPQSKSNHHQDCH